MLSHFRIKWLHKFRKEFIIDIISSSVYVSVFGYGFDINFKGDDYDNFGDYCF